MVISRVPRLYYRRHVLAEILSPVHVIFPPPPPPPPLPMQLQYLQAFPVPDRPSVTNGGNSKVHASLRRQVHMSAVVSMDLLPPAPPVVLPQPHRHKRFHTLKGEVVRRQKHPCTATGGLPSILIDGSWVGKPRMRSRSTVVLPSNAAASIAESFKHRRRASDSDCLDRRRHTGMASLHAVDMGTFFGSLPLWLQRVRDALGVDSRDDMSMMKQLTAVMRGALSCGNRVLTAQEQANMRVVGKLFESLASKLAIIDLNAQYMMEGFGGGRLLNVPPLRRPPRSLPRNAKYKQAVRSERNNGDTMGIVGNDFRSQTPGSGVFEHILCMHASCSIYA